MSLVIKVGYLPNKSVLYTERHAITFGIHVLLPARDHLNLISDSARRN
ncbi:uncharacterized protein J3R85_003750 [Psidium guajava]|nr:uncharacterized protein J3R85_003750 [Psidium guajava]